MGIRGIRECHDIDIIVTEDVWESFPKKLWEVRVVPNGSMYLWKENIE